MDIGAVSGSLEIQKQIASQNEKNKTEEFSEALKKAAKQQDNEKLKEACQQLESYMLTQVYKQMKTSMLTGESLIEKGDYETTFEYYLIQARCDEMSKSGGIGLADAMYKQITNMYATNAKLNVEEDSVSEGSALDITL